MVAKTSDLESRSYTVPGQYVRQWSVCIRDAYYVYFVFWTSQKENGPAIQYLVSISVCGRNG